MCAAREHCKINSTVKEKQRQMLGSRALLIFFKGVSEV